MKRFHVPLKFHYKWTRLYNFMQILFKFDFNEKISCTPKISL